MVKTRFYIRGGENYGKSFLGNLALQKSMMYFNNLALFALGLAWVFLVKFFLYVFLEIQYIIRR